MNMFAAGFCAALSCVCADDGNLYGAVVNVLLMAANLAASMVFRCAQ